MIETTLRSNAIAQIQDTGSTGSATIYVCINLGTKIKTRKFTINKLCLLLRNSEKKLEIAFHFVVLTID